MAFGAVLGVRGLLDPHWAARLVRLQESGPGGFSEFRATFGGLFLASQAAGLALLGALLSGAGEPARWAALGAIAVCGAMWLGTGIARIVSLVLDRADTPFHRVAVGLELVMGVAILLPWLVR